MTLTNELDLPEPIVRAIKGHDYSYTHRDGARKRACDFTTTQLIAPYRITVLRQKYDEHLTDDASDRIFALIGNAIHSILETANDQGAAAYDLDGVLIYETRYLVERRFYGDFAGGRLGGRIDVYDTQTATLDDYKICSYHVMSDGIKPEWTAQASINALLMFMDAGLKVKRARIIAIFRDWSKMRAGFRQVPFTEDKWKKTGKVEKGYPARQVAVLDVPLWDTHRTLSYINERIAALRDAEQNGPPVCTPEERWRKPDQWALKKRGAKRASKLYDTEADALKATEDESGIYYVEDRPGEDVRCLNYCPVTAYCSYFRELMEAK